MVFGLVRVLIETQTTFALVMQWLAILLSFVLFETSKNSFVSLGKRRTFELFVLNL